MKKKVSKTDNILQIGILNNNYCGRKPRLEEKYYFDNPKSNNYCCYYVRNEKSYNNIMEEFRFSFKLSNSSKPIQVFFEIYLIFTPNCLK